MHDKEKEELLPKAMVVGQLTWSPAGLTDGVIKTLPLKLFRLRRVKEAAPLPPELMLEPPAVDIVKSPTWTTVVAE